MNKRVIVVLVILAIVVVGFLIYRKKAGEEMTGTVHQVKISKGNPPTARPDPVVIKLGEEVEWNADGEDFDVTFKDSPFERNDFHKGNPKSGKPTKKGEFKYSIKIGGVEVDPSVIIKD